MSNFLLKAKYAGNNTYRKTSSNYSFINFTKKQYTIEIYSSEGTIIQQNTTTTITITTKNILNSNYEKVNNLILTVKNPDRTIDTYNTFTVGENNSQTLQLKLTQKGKYKLTASIPSTADTVGSTKKLNLNTDSITTSLTLTYNKKDSDIYVNDTITFTATLKDANQTPLRNKTIKLYKDYNTTPISTATTNTNGIASFSVKINPSDAGKLVSFQAVFAGDGPYIQQSTKWDDIELYIWKYDVDIGLNQEILYPNWYLDGTVRAFRDLQPVKSGRLDIQVTGGITQKYTIYPDKAGYWKTPVLNATKDIHIKIQYSDTAGIYSSEEIERDIPVYTNVTYQNTKITAKNYKTGEYTTGKRYREWNKLNQVLLLNEAYAECGTSCSDYDCIGTKSGTWNRPSPIIITDFMQGVPDNSIITGITVNLDMYKYLCEVYECNIGAPTISYKGGSSKIATVDGSSGIPISEDLCTVSAKWNNLNLTGTIINSDSFFILIDFPSNPSPAKCRLFIDRISVIVEYKPSQGV